MNRCLRIGGGWSLALAAFGVVLLGRFDWAEGVYAFSVRGYASSLFLLVPTLVTLYCVVRLLRPEHRWNAVVVTVSAGLLFTLPYRWLGLDDLHHYRARPAGYLQERLFAAVPRLETDRNEWGQAAWERAPGIPPADWRPALIDRPGPTPGEGLVPAAIAAAALVGLAVLWRRRSRRQGRAAAAVSWLMVLLALALQTWAHVSLRSPYSYATHHYLPLEGNYWHLAFLIGPSEGAVNADVIVFQDLEQHFWGTPRATSTVLLRRPLLAWIASQLTYFFNVFHVYVALNLALWLSAVAALHAFVREELDRESAWYAALLAACGPGFLMFVAQPLPNFAGYAVVAVLVWMTGRILRGGGPIPTGHWVALAGFAGLGLLVYDIFPWLLFVLLYGLLHGVPRRPLVGALAAAATLYGGFVFLQSRVLGLDLDTSNSRPLTEAMANIADLVAGMRLLDISRLSLDFAEDYSRGMAIASFLLPLAAAVAGLAFLRTRRVAVVALLLVLPAAIGVGFLSYGQAIWGAEKLAPMPRFSFPAYPAIYFLAGFGLRELRRLLVERGWARSGARIAVGAIVAAFILANLDVLIGLPQPYYWFYWSSGGHF